MQIAIFPVDGENRTGARPLVAGSQIIKESFMMRSWLRASVCVLTATLFGCGGDSRESIITNTNNSVSEVATSAGNIKSKVDEFVRKKDAKDDEGAKKELDEAIDEAKKLEQTAKKLQNIERRSNAVGNLTAEEKKAFLKKFEARINTTRDEAIAAHRDMKKSVADANAKYEEAMRPLMQELSRAEGEFAALTRRK